MASPRLLAPLRSSDYRMLWIAQLVSVVGDKVHQIAMSVLVYKLTGSVAHVGAMLAITTLPAVFFGVPAGVFVDRWDRRATMVASDVLRAAIVLSIPLLIRVGMPAVYVAAFCVATVSLFFEPARLSLIPEIVPADDLMAANSLDNVTASVSELLGLVGAAGIVAAMGVANAFYLDAATFTLSAMFVAFVVHRGRATEAEPAAPFVHELRRGISHIADTHVLRDLVSVYSLAAAGIAAAVLSVNGLALQRYGATDSSRAIGLALLDGAITVGLLVGSVTIGQSGSGAAGRKFLGSLTVFGLAFVLVAFAPGIWTTVPLLFIGGVANMWFYVPGATLIQRIARPELRGRVFAAKNAMSRVATTVGFFGAGLLADRIGLSSTVLLVGVLVVMVSAFGWSRPALREA
ncbi:MAG: hypothetical protein CVT66_09710 [Actinobacteria bacterium HGW-Actinobacteria-6]|jgi:MFS family permease|nr:MAG: hypothetical protein CVT66_09710 [Actinobacteria bacterium HGW-Actinobacteria-6]